MSIRSRREILLFTKKRYQEASTKDESKILDAFVNRFRAKTVKTLKTLPGPKRD